MNERIALGFHTCVDYELKWDTQVVEAQIKAFDIHADELKLDIEVDSERAIWIMSLAHLQAGIGCEMVPSTSEVCVEFANHFDYEVTLGEPLPAQELFWTAWGIQAYCRPAATMNM